MFVLRLQRICSVDTLDFAQTNESAVPNKHALFNHFKVTTVQTTTVGSPAGSASATVQSDIIQYRSAVCQLRFSNAALDSLC